MFGKQSFLDRFSRLLFDSLSFLADSSKKQVTSLFSSRSSSTNCLSLLLLRLIRFLLVFDRILSTSHLSKTDLSAKIDLFTRWRFSPRFGNSEDSRSRMGSTLSGTTFMISSFSELLSVLLSCTPESTFWKLKKKILFDLPQHTCSYLGRLTSFPRGACKSELIRSTLLNIN